jgi:hypothetical protein
VSEPLTVYIDASLLTDGGADSLAVAAELGMITVVVDDHGAVPDEILDAWHLAAVAPEVGSLRWSRTVVVGPRLEAGRRTVTGLRTARDVRLALLELASESATSPDGNSPDSGTEIARD